MTRRQLWMAYSIGAFGLSMNGQMHLLVSLRARELGASFEIIGLLIASGALVGALAAVPLGNIVDRLGPRRTFILGTGLVAASAAGFMLVTAYWALLPLQLAIGGSRSLAWIASQGYVTDIGGKAERAHVMGRFGFFSNVGSMIGPLAAGGIAQLVGLRLSFSAVAVYALVFCTLGVFLVETRQSRLQGSPRRGVGLRMAGGLLRERGMQVVLMLSGARLWTNWAWTSFFPVFLTDNGLEPGVIGSVVFAKALTATVMAPTTGFWSRFVSRPVATGIGLVCGALGLAVSPLLPTVPEAYLAAVLVGIAIGVSLPLLMAIVGDVVAPEQRGVAVGLRVSVNQTAGMAAPLLVGPVIAALGAATGFLASGGVAGLIVAVALLRHRGMTDRPPVPDPTR